MRRYETVTIIDPDLSEEERRPVLERVESLIPEQKGLVVETDEWGARKLAYEIKKKSRGYYVRFDYCGTGELVNEIERFFRIDDRVLKYMTVLLEENVDLDKIKEIIAAVAEAKKAKPVVEAAASEEPPASDAPESKAAEETGSAATSEAESAEQSAEQADEQSDTGENAGQSQAESADTAATSPESEPPAETPEENASVEETLTTETAESDTDTETEKK